MIPTIWESNQHRFFPFRMCSSMNDPVQNPYTAHQPGSSSTSGSPGSLRQSVLTGKVITGALAMGCLMILIVMFAISEADEAPKRDFLLPAVGVGLAVSALVAAFVLCKVTIMRAVDAFRRDATDEDRVLSIDGTATGTQWNLFSAAQTSTIVGQALCEGPAVANMVFALLDNEWLIHGSVVAVLIVALLIQIPTVGKRKALFDEAIA